MPCMNIKSMLKIRKKIHDEAWMQPTPRDSRNTKLMGVGIAPLFEYFLMEGQ